MRRDTCGHPDGDALSTVDQKVWETRWKYDGLGSSIVVGWDEIHGVEFEVFEHHRSGPGKASFRVPHGRCRQPGDGAKVSLFVDKHMPHVPFLGHANQRWIDDGFAVRVVVSGGIPGDLGTLDPRCTGGQVQVVHGDQDASLGGFEPIANVWQCAADDNAHRIRQITFPQFDFDGFFDHPFATATGIAGGR